MNAITLPSHVLASLAVMAFSLAGFGASAAESGPDTENGRYTLSQTADGFIRLDTRTGAVSTCSHDGNGWACYAVPDERKALDQEIGRLEAENEKLKAQLASRDGAPGKTEEALPKAGNPITPNQGERKIEIPLPSDADIDRAMSFLQRAWRRLVDMANQMQRDASGKI